MLHQNCIVGVRSVHDVLCRLFSSAFDVKSMLPFFSSVLHSLVPSLSLIVDGGVGRARDTIRYCSGTSRGISHLSRLIPFLPVVVTCKITAMQWLSADNIPNIFSVKNYSRNNMVDFVFCIEIFYREVNCRVKILPTA